MTLCNLCEGISLFYYYIGIFLLAIKGIELQYDTGYTTKERAAQCVFSLNKERTLVSVKKKK